MKSVLFAAILMLFGHGAFAMSEEEIECGRELLLSEAQKAIVNMSVEDLKLAIEKLQEAEAKKEQEQKDIERADKLARLLLLMEKKGKVFIEDCTKLTIKEKNDEAKAILEEIKANCENSPQNIWAEITKTGQLKFTFASGSNGGTKTLTIGGGTNLTLGLRGHEIKLGGNIASSTIRSQYTSATLKYDHLLDYSIDLGITNLESFIKWQGTYESSQVPNIDRVDTSNIRRNTIDLGLRYNFIETDVLKIKIGGGAGANYLVQGGSLQTPMDKLAPNLGVTYEMIYRPVKDAELFINTRLQRDILTYNARTVAGVKGGVKMKTGPVGMSIEYGTDYDGARSGNRLNHQLMLNVISSIDPLDWKTDKKRKELKAAIKRERLLWEKTLKKVQELREQD